MLHYTSSSIAYRLRLRPDEAARRQVGGGRLPCFIFVFCFLSLVFFISFLMCLFHVYLFVVFFGQMLELCSLLFVDFYPNVRKHMLEPNNLSFESFLSLRKSQCWNKRACNILFVFFCKLSRLSEVAAYNLSLSLSLSVYHIYIYINIIIAIINITAISLSEVSRLRAACRGVVSDLSATINHNNTHN